MTAIHSKMIWICFTLFLHPGKTWGLLPWGLRHMAVQEGVRAQAKSYADCVKNAAGFSEDSTWTCHVVLNKPNSWKCSLVATSLIQSEPWMKPCFLKGGRALGRVSWLLVFSDWKELTEKHRGLFTCDLGMRSICGIKKNQARLYFSMWCSLNLVHNKLMQFDT